jgi:metallo-beta-lactamase family protein
MKLQFLGATGTVTGSRYLVTEGNTRILVDCGLFQGVKSLRLRNWKPFPIKPSELDAVVLTHAHLDHSGYLPRLIRDGFAGPVYCTPATRALAEILLPDSGNLQEEDAERANRYGYSKHNPAEALYTEQQAEHALKAFETRDFHNAFAVGSLRVKFTPAGHILGAACVHVENAERKLCFSGDLGRPNDPLMQPPMPVGRADYLVLESTYGDRRHPEVDAAEQLATLVNTTVGRSGTVMLPAFAVGRAQTLLHLLTQLRATGRIPAVPFYLDSPMAIEVTQVMCHFRAEHRLSEAECHALCEGVTYVHSAQDSQALSADPYPKIIIAGAGMLTGGRILHHLKALGGNHHNSLLIAGYQAEGTRGHALLHGIRRLKIYGDYVPINCQVEEVDSLSAHADYVEIGDWLSHFEQPPRQVFLTHGEALAADSQRRYLEERLGWDVLVPEMLDEFVLD